MLKASWKQKQNKQKKIQKQTQTKDDNWFKKTDKLIFLLNQISLWVEGSEGFFQRK